MVQGADVREHEERLHGEDHTECRREQREPAQPLFDVVARVRSTPRGILPYWVSGRPPIGCVTRLAFPSHDTDDVQEQA